MIHFLKRAFLVTARIDQEHASKRDFAFPATGKQRVFPLAVTLAKKSSEPVSDNGRTRLSNGKSHHTLVRWDFPLHVVIEPNTAVLHMGTTGKYMAERPEPSKNLALRDAVVLRIIGASARH